MILVHILSVLLLAASTFAGIMESLPARADTPESPRRTVGTERLIAQGVPDRLRNPWNSELERGFWQRADHSISCLSGRKSYGNTYFENEKRSYPYAMFDFLAGRTRKSLAFLQAPDNQAEDNAHTLGIDLYPCFTLKGQMRKYFLLGDFLDADYKTRMHEAAKIWTAVDPLHRPHPKHGTGSNENSGWGPDRRGGWVDGRNTDNLRAMRDTSVYLMAEETKNEAVRKLAKDRIRKYVTTLYSIGMGEWDSETYLGHIIAPYLNLYDFAKDEETKLLAKSALDWFFAAGAVKYYRGGFGGPTKRDYGRSIAAYAAGAARFLELYFDDVPFPNPEPDLDQIHAITSPYRPPQAIVALAKKKFPRPVEMRNTKPAYENWLPGKNDRPAFWETMYFGNTYQFGSVVSKGPDGDVSPFKLMAYSEEHGVDFVVANSDRSNLLVGKRKGDQIGQFQNLLIWLCKQKTEDDSIYFLLPEDAIFEGEGNIWFVRLEKTWLAIYPVNLDLATPSVLPLKGKKDKPLSGKLLKCLRKKEGHYGFAMEVSDSFPFAAFKSRIQKSQNLDLSRVSEGSVTLTGLSGSRLGLRYNHADDLPNVTRNGTVYEWVAHRDIYSCTGRSCPISQPWKGGRLRVEAGGLAFEETVSPNGRVSFREALVTQDK